MNQIAMIEELVRCLPTVSPEGQRTGVVVLHELAEGSPLAITEFAQTLGSPAEAVRALLRDSALSPELARLQATAV